MKGGVTQHMLPCLSGVTHLHANRPLESKFLKCDLSLWGVVWSTYLSLDFIGEGWSWSACTLQVFPLQRTVDVCAQACWVKSKKKKTLFNCLPATGQDVTVRPGKPRTLDISQECLLCYDQSQQRSRHANWPQNHKLINDLACGLVFSRLIGFFLEQNNIPEQEP